MAFQVNNFLSFSEEIPVAQILHFKFEKLCAEPINISMQIAQFLKTPMTDACLDFIKNNIDTSKIGQFNENDSCKINEVTEYLAPEIRKLLYI